MKKTENQILVTGNFTKAEAKEILSSLFRSKIQFHTISAFGGEERATKKAKDHAKRKKELVESLDILNEFLEKGGKGKSKVSINCEVKLSFGK
jgi:hypothetical protein